MPKYQTNAILVFFFRPLDGKDGSLIEVVIFKVFFWFVFLIDSGITCLSHT